MDEYVGFLVIFYSAGRQLNLTITLILFKKSFTFSGGMNPSALDSL